MLDQIFVAIPVTAAAAFAAAHLQHKARLRKFIFTHIHLHTRSMTQMLAAATAVAQSKNQEWTDESFAMAVMAEGRKHGLALSRIDNQELAGKVLGG